MFIYLYKMKFMKLKELIKKNRSYRRFNQNYKVSTETLISLIDLARISPSARNAQPLKYYISNTPDKNELIFTKLSWAGYLTEWNGPIEGEKPSAYVVLLVDKSISNNHYCDDGIAAQSIMLGATETGLGGCIIAAIDRKALSEELKISDNLEILLVLSLGKPIEEVKLELIDKSGDFKYWRDENQVHHVPKRSLDDIIINNH